MDYTDIKYNIDYNIVINYNIEEDKSLDEDICKLDRMLEQSDQKEDIFKIIFTYFPKDMILRYIKRHNIDVHSDSFYINKISESNCDIEIIQFLHQQGANLNADDGMPLLNAVKNKNFEVIKYLIENGATVQPKHIDYAIVFNSSKLIIEYLYNNGGRPSSTDVFVLKKMMTDFVEIFA